MIVGIGCKSVIHNSQKPAGFTLVELLVAMAIISVLASLLLPALTKAMESAKEVREMSILRNMGSAHSMYIDDWDGCVIPFRTSISGGADEFYFQKIAGYLSMNGYSTTKLRTALHCYRIPDFNPYAEYSPFYWHIARRNAATTGWMLYQFYGGAACDWSWNIRYGGGGGIRIFDGNDWPKLSRVKYFSTQVLTRCPGHSRHDEMRRGNVFFDGHGRRFIQVSDTQLNE